MAFGNQQNHNALHKAAYGGHQLVCEWLQDEVGLDARAELLDKNHQSPVRLAEKAGHNELAAFLIRHRKQDLKNVLKPLLPENDGTHLVFVYGTLKDEFKNHYRFLEPYLAEAHEDPPPDGTTPWGQRVEEQTSAKLLLTFCSVFSNYKAQPLYEVRRAIHKHISRQNIRA